MMPFLYQTRTLSSFNWTCLNSVCRAQYKPALRRNFSAYHARYSFNERNIPTPWKGTTDDAAISLNATTEPRDYDSRANQAPPPNFRVEENDDGNAGDFTITRGGKAIKPGAKGSGLKIRDPNAERHQRRAATFSKPTSSPATSIDTSSLITNPRGEMTTTARTYDMGMEESDEFTIEEENFDTSTAIEDDPSGAVPSEIAALSRNASGEESTITPSERLAFQKIFSDIFSRNDRVLDPNDDGTLEERKRDATPRRVERARTQLSDIIMSAAKGVAQDVNSRAGREGRDTYVNSYPKALRAAAARAMGVLETRKEEAAKYDGTELYIDDWENLRLPERVRVENLMKAAKTDLELWEILDKEVFSLISKLGLKGIATVVLEESPVPIKTPKKGTKLSRRRERDMLDRGRGLKLTRTPIEERQQHVDGISPLVLYGPLYPSFLLLGLRLLDRAFAKPSPLSLSLLPKIKSLGLISHVLGGTTQLYNELIQIHRYRYDDYRGVLKLLDEMDHFGVGMDEKTSDLILNIMHVQASVQRGGKGDAVRALWTLPEFAPGKFTKWKLKIENHLEAKRMRAEKAKQEAMAEAEAVAEEEEEVEAEEMMEASEEVIEAEAEEKAEEEAEEEAEEVEAEEKSEEKAKPPKEIV